MKIESVNTMTYLLRANEIGKDRKRKYDKYALEKSKNNIFLQTTIFRITIRNPLKK